MSNNKKTTTNPSASGSPLTWTNPDELQRAAMCAMSRVIAEKVQPLASANTTVIARVLEGVARTEVLNRSTHVPPFDPAFEPSERPRGASVARNRLKEFSPPVTPEVIEAYWKRAERRYDLATQLPPEWLEEILPADYWPVLISFIQEGPAVSGRKVEFFLEEYMHAPSRECMNRERTDRKGESTLNTITAGLNTLSRHLGVLVPEFPSALGGWERGMKIRRERGARYPMKHWVPALPLIRKTFRALHAEVLSLLGCEPGEEREAIASLSESKLTYGGLFRPFRSLVLFTMMVTTGSRPGALLRLTLADFDGLRELPDGEVGPAVALEPRKTWARGERSIKPLGEAAHLVKAWIELLHRMVPDLDPTNFRLFPADLSGKPMNGEDLWRWAAGTKDGRVKPVLSKPSDPTRGCAPYRFRAAATKLLESLAAAVHLERHGIDIPQRLLPTALLDHNPGDLAVIYNKVNTPEGRAEAAAVAIDINWQLMTGDLGARRALDADRYREALRDQLSLTAERERLGGERQRVSDEVVAGRLDPAVAMPKLFDSFDAALRLSDELHRAEYLIERIGKGDPDYLIVLDDDAPESAATVDLKQIEAEVLGHAGTNASGARPAVRDWLTIGEFAQIAGVTEKTVRDWTDGKKLPRNERDRPWTSDRVPVDASDGRKRRRLIVAGISQAYLDRDPMRQKLVDQYRADLPANWNPKYCPMAATRPDWMTATRLRSGRR